MTPPRVSVCVPTYNRSRTLVRTIDAIINQTYTDWELVICDDGSSDDTEAVVNQYTDPRIRFYRNEKNLGLYENWHRCIDLAAGEFIAIYHDHDTYLPSILEESMRALERFPTASFVHTAWLAVSPEGTILRLDLQPFSEFTDGEAMVKKLAHGWHSPVMAPTAIVRSSAYKRVGRYRYQEYGLGCDLDMWLRLAQIGDVAYVREPQALITVRVPGQFTDIFRWSECVKDAAMYRDHLDLVFHGNPARHRYELAKFSVTCDKYFLSRGVRALYLESPVVVTEGDTVIRQHCHLPTYLAYQVIRHNEFIKSIVGKTLWPRHRRQVKAMLDKNKRVALAYLETHTGLCQQLLDAGFSLPTLTS